MSASLLAFSLVALILVITPGPDFATVVPNALRGRGVSTSFGTASGLAVHAGIAVAGLSSIVLASDVAFSIVKYAGAAFLIYLGVKAIYKSSRSSSHKPVQPENPRPAGLPLTAGHAYRQGFLVNVLNPKAPLIYLSIMPQFMVTGVSTTTQLLLKSLVLVGLALTWYFVLTALVTTLRPLINRASRWIDRVTGAVLIALGIRVALEVRPA